MLFLIEEKLFGLVYMYMYMYLSMKLLLWPAECDLSNKHLLFWKLQFKKRLNFQKLRLNNFQKLPLQYIVIIFDLVHPHVYHNNIAFAEVLKGCLTVWSGYYCLFISLNLAARFGYFSWNSSFTVHMGIYTYLFIVIKFSPSKQTIQNDYQFF